MPCSRRLSRALGDVPPLAWGLFTSARIFGGPTGIAYRADRLTLGKWFFRLSKWPRLERQRVGGTCRQPNDPETPMQYLLLLYAKEGGWSKLTKEQQEQAAAAYGAYAQALRKEGVLQGSNRLQATTAATTVRIVDGKSQVLDGPYADSKEQLGGYFLIDVPDLDAALSWAARCPGASHGTVEVRPVWSMS